MKCSSLSPFRRAVLNISRALLGPVLRPEFPNGISHLRSSSLTILAASYTHSTSASTLKPDHHSSSENPPPPPPPVFQRSPTPSSPPPPRPIAIPYPAKKNVCGSCPSYIPRSAEQRCYQIRRPVASVSLFPHNSASRESFPPRGTHWGLLAQLRRTLDRLQNWPLQLGGHFF